MARVGPQRHRKKNYSFRYGKASKNRKLIMKQVTVDSKVCDCFTIAR